VSLLGRLLGWAPAPWVDANRWVVVDVETSGLDMQRDSLLAIAAIALQFDGQATPRIVLGDSFEVVLRQAEEPADKDNILLHGIGVGEQRAGAPAAEALAAFEHWLAGAPLLAFHAVFDRIMIRRTMKAALGRAVSNPWIDLEPIADALHPQVGGRALDDWLTHFGIECAARHQAAADALATAELLLRLWPAARTHRCTTFATLRRLAGHRRWLAPR